MNLFIILILNIIAGLVGFISAEGKIYDRRRKGIKRIRNGGWWLIGCFLTTTLMSIVQDVVNRRDLQNKEEEATLELQKRDSIARSVTIESNKNIVASFTKSLAEYGLKYDSTQKVIEKIIKDSLSRSVTILQANDPVYAICMNNGITLERSADDTLVFKLAYCHRFSPYNIKVTLNLAVSVYGKLIKVKTFDFGDFKAGHEVDGETYSLPIAVLNRQKANYIYFYSVNSFTNRSNTKQYKIEDVYAYQVETKHVFLVPSMRREQVKQLFD